MFPRITPYYLACSIFHNFLQSASIFKYIILYSPFNSCIFTLVPLYTAPKLRMCFLPFFTQQIYQSFLVQVKWHFSFKGFFPLPEAKTELITLFWILYYWLILLFSVRKVHFIVNVCLSNNTLCKYAGTCFKIKRER